MGKQLPDRVKRQNRRREEYLKSRGIDPRLNFQPSAFTGASRLDAHISGATYNAEIDANTGGKIKYIVAPVSMIVPGVLHGSKGALMYGPDDIAENVQDWNGIPLTYGHPYNPVTGEPSSSSSAGVKERQVIGHVRSPHISEDGKLRAKAYFNVDRVRRICPHVLQELQAGKKVEVSTGLFTTNFPAPPGSHYNGKEFTHYARNFVPDHLAVLTDTNGACSVRDGCGVNNSDEAMPIFNAGCQHGCSSATPCQCEACSVENNQEQGETHAKPALYPALERALDDPALNKALKEFSKARQRLAVRILFNEARAKKA